jgi:rod shape-determining protein MreB
MHGLYQDVGIDLGTANTLVHVRGRGVVVREPSVVALDRQAGRILAFGEEARRMLGRTPGHIVALRPMRDGVIADYGITEAMLRHYVGRVCGRHLFRPRVMVCVPSGITTVEKRAVLDAAMAAGARRVHLIEEPMAAALGAGIDISSPSGSLVVDIGGGTSDVAVLSLNGIVISSSLRIGGDRLDESIARHVKREYNLLIGERTAEEVKIQVGTADAAAVDRGCVEVRGRDLVSGLPRTVRLSSRDTYAAMEEPLRSIVAMVRAVMERTPPELAADVLAKGLVLTGGGALLHGLDRLLARETGLPVIVAEDPLSCVAVGTGRALEMLDALQEARAPAQALV